MSEPNQELDLAAEKAAREKEAAEQAALPYQWRQTIGDLDISVPVPKGTRGRDLIVEIKKHKLKVSLKGKEPIIDVRVSHVLSTTLYIYSRHLFTFIYRVSHQKQSKSTSQHGLLKTSASLKFTWRKSTRWNGGHM